MSTPRSIRAASRGFVVVLAPGAEPPAVEEVGGKAHHLARLATLGAGAAASFAVPRFIVVGTRAFDEVVRGDRWWPRDAAEAEGRAAEVRTLDPPEFLRAELNAALEATGLGSARLAVRSSAAGEDSRTRSFAGQFDSILGVRHQRGDDGALWDAVRAVWASAFNAHAAAYDAGQPSHAPGVRMAVVIQEMVDPFSSGVAFSADPVTGDRSTAVVSAVYGLGEGLVGGAMDADTYRVRPRTDGAEEVIAALVRKDQGVRMAEGGRTRLEPVPEPLRDTAALGDDEVRTVAACVRSLAEAFGAPQDVEWALVGPSPGARRLVVLQTRPITTLGAAVDRGERRLWDNSNIAESYSGVTTPLTFSFARSVYEDVYRQFCSLMGTRTALLESYRPVFANMLGLVRGRIYYNLLNWYRTLALLPGFRFNRSFMERMMGVRDALESPPEPPGTGSRMLDLLDLIRMGFRMVAEARRLGTEVPAFHARVEAALAPLASDDVAEWPAERALALYLRLERELLEHWRAPLVNDFFAMIFFGVLGRLTEKWLPDSPPTLVNDLLCGEGGIISTEPARRVMGLARRVTETPALAARFAAEADDQALLATLEREPAAAAFTAELREYVARFGDRCMEELKLETVTHREDPRFLMAMIRAYAASGHVDPTAAWERERAIRASAERTVAGRLGGPKRAMFRWVLTRARRRIRDRENLRFERTRVFGVVRRIFVALGRHLAAAGQLGEPREVFYLTREELFAYFQGTGVTRDLRSLARQRRSEFEAYAREPAPPERFETFGSLEEWTVPTSPPGPGGEPAAELRGTGCCPGVVRARVRVVRDPRGARDLGGHILVAERTDPGWTLLFPAASGLLVQRGSLLSHSAIVAREMGLPCVVGIAHLLDTLRDGELVEMDGASGLVRRLEVAP